MSLVRFRILAVLAVSWLAPAPAVLAQFPDGSQLQVNTYTTGLQVVPGVAPIGAGAFVVVWTSVGSAGTDTSGWSVQGQRYDSSGAPQGGEFQVNSYTTGDVGTAAVAADAAGNFVVVWTSNGSAGTDTADWSVQGRRYDSGGTPQGDQFQVNTYTTGNPTEEMVAADATGNFVVVWASYGSAGTDTSGLSVQGQRYDSSGTPQGGEFQINTYTTGTQVANAVATDSTGNFVVVWRSDGSAGTDTSGHSMQGRRFDSSGTPQGGEFQINTYTTGNQFTPVVASEPAGNFVVVWASDGGEEGNYSFSVQGQRYDSSGTPQGGQFQVNSYITGHQSGPAVVSAGAGDFVVLWRSDGSAGTDTSGTSIQGRRYDSAGTPQGGQFQVNTYTTGFQQVRAAAADGLGRFVVLWESDGSAGTDTSSWSIQSQRFVVGPTAELLPGRIAVIKPGTLAKFVAIPTTGDTFTLPFSNPVTAGGSLRIYDVAATAGDDTFNLPSGPAWKGLGNPPGTKGYKYKGAGTPADPCKVVLLKENVIKGVCKGTGITLAPPFTGNVGIVLSVGATDSYCASFGGEEVKNDTTLTKRKNAPGACP